MISESSHLPGSPSSVCPKIETCVFLKLFAKERAIEGYQRVFCLDAARSMSCARRQHLMLHHSPPAEDLAPDGERFYELLGE